MLKLQQLPVAKYDILPPRHVKIVQRKLKLLITFNHKGFKMALTKFEVNQVKSPGRVCYNTKPGNGDYWSKTAQSIKNGQLPVEPNFNHVGQIFYNLKFQRGASEPFCNTEARDR